jgi:hypothetical protein
VNISSDQVYGNELSGEHLSMWATLHLPGGHWAPSGYIADIRHSTATPCAVDVTLHQGKGVSLVVETPVETIVRFDPPPRGA